MRNLPAISVLLLGASWAAAQSYPSSSPSQSSSQSSASSTQGSDTGQAASSSNASGQTTVVGCLSGSSGSYTLTAENGASYPLTGDTSQLSDHVGHQVQIKGTTQSSSSASTPSSSTGANAASSGEPSSSGQQTLSVSSVKHIAKTCSTTGSPSR